MDKVEIEVRLDYYSKHDMFELLRMNGIPALGMLFNDDKTVYFVGLRRLLRDYDDFSHARFIVIRQSDYPLFAMMNPHVLFTEDSSDE